MANRTHWKWRIVVALIAGLLVATITLLPLGWNRDEFVRPQLRSWKQLQRKERHVQAFRARYNRLPKSLSEITKLDDGKIHEFKNDEELSYFQDNFDYYEDNRDDWGRPIIYTVQGDRFTLSSYGADGKPGGAGLDMDLTSDTAFSALPPPIWLQLVFHPLVPEIRGSALIGGIIAFLLTLAVVRARDFVAPNSIALRYSILITKLIVTVLPASFVAIAMAITIIYRTH